MVAQSGKDLLVKLDVDGTGQFETVAGLRATRIAFNAETIDVTTIESPGGWREILGGAGIKSANLSGSGVFKDEATDQKARELFFASQLAVYQIIIPDFGRIEGQFQLTFLEYAGSYNGEANYEMSLASAGELTFAAL